MKNERLGFIGVGQMGKSMAVNLKKAGYDVHIFDVNEMAMQEIQEYGIVTCYSCKDVALAVDNAIIIMVRDDKQVKNVIWGEEGLASSGKQGLGLIVTSTIGLSSARELGRDAVDAGFRMINAPVSGAPHGAEQGTLTFMVSGDEDLYAKCKPIFEAMGKKIFYFGTKQETAQAVKLANNLIYGINVIALIEGFHFAQSMGISDKAFKEVLLVSTGNSWVAQNREWIKAVWEEEDRPESQIIWDIMAKDLRAVINESNIPLPLTALATQFWLSKKLKKEH